MCFGGGGQAPQYTPPPAPKPPPPPPPVQTPPQPPPLSTTLPVATKATESAQLKTNAADVEAKQMKKKGTAALKKKKPVAKSTTLKEGATPEAKAGSGLSYGGNISGAGASLNIQKN